DTLVGTDFRPGERVPGCQEDDGHGRGWEEGGGVGKGKDPGRRHGDLLRVAPEEREGDDPLAGPELRDAVADGLDRAGDLHAGDERRLRGPRVRTGPDVKVGEIQADRDR